MREKYNANKRAIELLSAGREEIEKAIPSGSGSGVSGTSSATISLKKLMEEVRIVTQLFSFQKRTRTFSKYEYSIACVLLCD